MSNFPLILVNSVGLHYKLIYHLPEIFNTKDAVDDETTVHYANNVKSTIIYINCQIAFLFCSFKLILSVNKYALVFNLFK